ncbi:hypothetical protein, partial [Chengkuizengella marina]
MNIKKTVTFLCIFLLVFSTLVIAEEMVDLNQMSASSLSLTQEDVKKTHIDGGADQTVGLK